MMKNRIALKLLAFFALALLVLVLVSSLMFRSLFASSIKDAKREEMLSRAASLSGLLAQARVAAPRGMQGMQGGAQGANYMNFIRVITQSEPNIWVLDENLEFLSSGRMMGRTLEYGELPPEAEKLVRDVFRGETSFSEGFSDLAGAPTLTVGAPIYEGKQVVGALLLNDAVSGIQDAVASGQRVLLFSAAAALLLSILLSVLFSFSFTRPISRMKATAGRLSEGDYSAKTGLSRKDEFGDLAASIDVLSDRLQAAREAGRRQEQQRNDFLANVSHELRTPVTVLRGSLEALSDGVVTEPGMVRDYYRQMLRETQGLQRLVNDLMELARLQNADFPIQSAPLSLQDVLLDALRGAERLAQGKDIHIQRDIIQTSVPFTGDYERLKQMLLIPLDNAVKFSPPQSALHVRMDPGGISVRDEGPGIPQEDLPFVFDRFYKSRSGENRQGSGLGLAIARQIARRHGMRITLDSREGQGTTVSFYWQQSDQADSPPLEEQS